MELRCLGLCVLLACTTMQARAVGRLADVVVVDRDSGASLPVYHDRGEYWVAGRPGARYAISVRNRLGERLMAVTSVDGVNVLSGETAGWDQSGYVFAPHAQYQITGWRKSHDEVAAFEFADARASYAARTGRPDHVGVIGVALFREKPPETLAPAPAYSRRNESDQGLPEARLGKAPAAPPAADAQAPAARNAAPAGALAENRADSTASAQDGLAAGERQAKAGPQALPMPKLGTGHGQREASVVYRTSFERLHAQPSEVVRIRYDSRENLVASGVIREPVPRPRLPGGNPFPQSDRLGYVPDPPAQRY